MASKPCFFHEKCLLILIVFAFLVHVEAEITVSPNDTEASIGEDAIIFCTSTYGSCEWYHLRFGASIHELLYQGGYIYNGYKERFNVSKTNDNACNLLIRDVRIEDAGMFTCMETSIKPSQKTAELIVFEQYPCNKTCVSKITCDPVCNDLELSCGMKSYGNMEPVMVWRDADGNLMNSTFSQDKTTSVIHLYESSLLSPAYSCQVIFPKKSLSSKYLWSFSTSVCLGHTTPTTTVIKEKPQQAKVLIRIVVIVVVIIGVLLSTCVILMLCMQRRLKRKARPREYTECGLSALEQGKHQVHEIPWLITSVVPSSFTLHRTNAVYGIATLDNEIFAVTRDKSIVDVFDLETLNFKRGWAVDGLHNPYDMSACPRKELLFICDWNKTAEETEILALDRAGQLKYRWHCTGKKARISVTKTSTLVVAESQNNTIHEYKINGQLLNTITVQTPKVKICQAVKLDTGNFVASFKDTLSKFHEISIISNTGEILDGIKNDPAYISSRSFSTPKSLAIDNRGNIYVSIVGEEPYGSRVMSFTPELEMREKFLDANEEDSLSGPLRICLHESDKERVLFVADSRKEDGMWMKGKIRILKLNL